MLSTDRATGPTSKSSRMQRCIGIIERCKSLRGRRYRPALSLTHITGHLASRTFGCFSLMDRPPSKPKAALWMAGWLALMLVVVVAGREAMREVNVFQLMEL